MRMAVTIHAAKIATTVTASGEVPCAQSYAALENMTAQNTVSCNSFQSMAKDSP